MIDPDDFMPKFLGVSLVLLIGWLLISGIQLQIERLKERRVYVVVADPRTMVALSDNRFVTYSAIRRVQVKP
jgi:hypothetical protein